MLPTIEKILADDDTALENAAEIELFRKLLELCEYLPEEEKAQFMASPVRMQMEYLIAKMSGTPGLLKTALSLKKAGVLGEDETVYLPQKNFSVTNHELRKVFKCMKELSYFFSGLHPKSHPFLATFCFSIFFFSFFPDQTPPSHTRRPPPLIPKVSKTKDLRH